MKLLNILKNWLLVLIMVVMTSGAASGKSASGSINLAADVHQGLDVSKSLNALGIAEVSTMFALDSPLATKGAAPPNLSPQGASRTGAFKEAKRQSGVPTSQQPSAVKPNIDRRGNVQPGKVYEFEVPAAGGGTKAVKIRDDAGGHDFGAGNAQNRGPHFNNEAGDHFDY